MLRLRANALFEPIDARHMAHWAIVASADNSHSVAAATAITKARVIDLRVKCIPKSYGFFSTDVGAGERSSFERKLSGKKTNKRQMQMTTAGTMVSTSGNRSKRRCIK